MTPVRPAACSAVRNGTGVELAQMRTFQGGLDQLGHGDRGGGVTGRGHPRAGRLRVRVGLPERWYEDVMG